jgi:tellurite resistance protein TehA-like permease
VDGRACRGLGRIFLEGEKMEKSKQVPLMWVGLIIGLLVYIFSLLNTAFSLLNTEECNKVINICSMALSFSLFSIIIIPLLFKCLVYDNTPKKSTFIMVHIFIAIFPLGMMGQCIFPGTSLLTVIFIISLTLLSMIITTYFVYREVKSIDSYHIDRLKFANLVLLTSFPLVCSILGLIQKGTGTETEIGTEMQTILILFCCSPLFFLRIMYEKILLEKECGENKNDVQQNPESQPTEYELDFSLLKGQDVKLVINPKK